MHRPPSLGLRVYFEGRRVPDDETPHSIAAPTKLCGTSGNRKCTTPVAHVGQHGTGAIASVQPCCPCYVGSALLPSDAGPVRLPSDAGPVRLPCDAGPVRLPCDAGPQQMAGGYALGRRTPRRPLNCGMLGNVLGLIPGTGSDAVHGSIRICHLLLWCPIACFWLCYAAHLVLVLVWFWLRQHGTWGVDLCAPSCMAALVTKSPGGVSDCGPSCFVTAHHALFGPFSPERGQQPMWWGAGVGVRPWVDRT